MPTSTRLTKLPPNWRSFQTTQDRYSAKFFDLLVNVNMITSLGIQKLQGIANPPREVGSILFARLHKPNFPFEVPKMTCCCKITPPEDDGEIYDDSMDTVEEDEDDDEETE